MHGLYDGTVGGTALLILHISYGIMLLVFVGLCMKDLIDEVK